MAIAWRLRNQPRANGGASPGLILDHDRYAEVFAQALPDQSREHVRASACGKGNDDDDGAGRKIGACGGCATHAPKRGEQQRKPAMGKTAHVVTLSWIWG